MAKDSSDWLSWVAAEHSSSQGEMRCWLFFCSPCWHRRPVPVPDTTEMGNTHQRCQRQQKLHYPHALNTASLEREMLTTSCVKTGCCSAAGVSEWDFRLNQPLVLRPELSLRGALGRESEGVCTAAAGLVKAWPRSQKTGQLEACRWLQWAAEECQSE